MAEHASLAHLKEAATGDWRDPVFRMDFLEDLVRARGFPVRIRRWRNG